MYSKGLSVINHQKIVLAVFISERNLKTLENNESRGRGNGDDETKYLEAEQLVK